MASAESGMTEMDDEVFIKEFVSTKKDAEGETTSKVRLRQNALMKYKLVKTKSMSRLESLEGIIAAGGSSKDLAAEMAITRRKSSVEVPQHHSQSSGDVFRRHSSLGGEDANIVASILASKEGKESQSSPSFRSTPAISPEARQPRNPTFVLKRDPSMGHITRRASLPTSLTISPTSSSPSFRNLPSPPQDAIASVSPPILSRRSSVPNSRPNLEKMWTGDVQRTFSLAQQQPNSAQGSVSASSPGSTLLSPPGLPSVKVAKGRVKLFRSINDVKRP